MTSPSHRDPCKDPLLEGLPEAEGYKVLDGRFVLYDVLGKGGMGVVYRGEHLGLGIEVAVKCLSPALALHDPQFVVRFEKEARAAARIDDPNVVRVHDVAQASGLHYIAMQYVAGENARQRVERKGPLPVGEAVTIALGAARGLAAAHRAGLVHRDVKPDNILVSADGEVKLADLGLSKMEGDMGMTYTGAAMGTPRYMPPEQYKDAKNVGARADVYSLGATLYFLLVGSDAIDGESPPEVMMQVCSGEFPRVKAKRPGIPEALDDLVALCTAQDVADRPASGTELVDQLLALDVGEESLRENQAEMTLLGVSQVSPPPMQTLMRIQATLAGNGPSKPEHSAGGGAAAGAAAGAAVGAAGAEPSESPAGKAEPSTEREGKLVWILAALLVLLLAWLLWRELGSGEEQPAVHKAEPRVQDTLQPVKRPWPEEDPPAVLAPVTLELTSPTVTADLWVTHRGWIRVQGQVGGARSEDVQVTVNGGAPAVYRLDKEGLFGFDRGVSSGDPQHFSVTTEGLPEPVTFAVVQDAVPPEIHVVSPIASERVTRADSVDIELVVKDEHLATVMVGSQVLQFLEGGRVVGNGVPLLRQGDNVLVITATDLAGQKTEMPLTVVRDGNAPAMLSAKPAAGRRVLAGTTFELQLTVDDRAAIVTVDGSRLAMQGSVARGQFAAPTTLGPWSLEFELCDPLGNCRSGAIEYIVYEETIVVPPVVLAEDSPAEAPAAESFAEAQPSTDEAVVDAAPAESPDTVSEALEEQQPSALADMTYVGNNAEGHPEYDLDLGGATMRFVSVPAGTFMMGSPENEVFRQSDEGPLHKVTVGPFLIAKYECTQAQWVAVMGDNPSNQEGDDLPVEQVSVTDCLEFAAAHNLSLPSEAQWEYAVRAGSDRASYAGLARCAWFSNASDGKSHPVGLLEANDFGLHDMLGNVSEICADSQHGDYNGAPNDGSAWSDSHVKRRMQRGGHFNDDYTRTRAACRTSIGSDKSRSHTMGFRPVRVLP